MLCAAPSHPSAEIEPTACFSVHAAASPGIMPRVLELFAKRGLVPSSWTSRVGADNELTIDIQMNGIDRRVTDYVAACLRQIVGVEIVLVSKKHRNRSPSRRVMDGSSRRMTADGEDRIVG